MSLRTALLVLAFVPGIALIVLWAVTSGQTYLDFQRQADQGLLAEKAGNPSNIVYYNLQEERRLSAEVLAGQEGADEELARQRASTDKAVDVFRTLSDDLSSAGGAPRQIREAVGEARTAIDRLPAQRTLVDSGDEDQQTAVYRYYTDLIAVDLELFTSLSQVDNGRITVLAQPLVDLFWTKEMISRSDALLARGWGAGTLTAGEFRQVREAVEAQSFLGTVKVAPKLSADERAMWQRITGSAAWKDKTAVEERVLGAGEPGAGGRITLDDDRETWRGAVDALTPDLEELLEHRTALVDEQGKDSVMALLFRMVLVTLVGLAAVLAVIWMTWRFTRGLRLRIGALQEQAEMLEAALPEVVERLARGERIDVEAEAKAIPQHGADRPGDELTRLSSALNLARTSALRAAVQQADQHRGFERLLQRIARRTQQLIGQQLKKLDEMERRHEDPEVLDGLFDLDHLTARLRRYEENLVILAGGTPHRRWREPVALLDVMRAAQGEVQDYRRVVLEEEGGHWLAARAVGPVAHVLAELVENALTFSRPPSPVEVRAAEVSRGLAVEIEDRGLGMEEEALAAANALMSGPQRLDVLAHSDDIRLGLHVVARLTHQYGLRVEFRASAFGGTRVVVLVPAELIVPAPQRGPVAVPAPEPARDAGEPLPVRVQGRAMADVTALIPAASREPHPAPSPAPDARDDSRPTGPHVPGTGGVSAPGDDWPSHGGSGAAHGRDDAPTPPDDWPSHTTAPHGSAPAHGTGGVAAPGEDWPSHGGSGAAHGRDDAPAPPGDRPSYTTAPHGSVPAHGTGGVSAPGDDWPSHGGSGAAHGAGLGAGVVRPGGADVPGGGRERAGAGGGESGLTEDDAPLPRRVRQASLVDELRVDPAAGTPLPRRPPRWQDDPMLRPVPRRAGATIGAFQRRSRAAREGRTPTPPESSAPGHPTREEES
ncbi:nitrate- and nitrite sensing domain-containing protein [Streptomyces fungicidicus]|uniref:nitrate- and nitrite sensing domain-containing protein n=1 Tax=Streptomyces fungicidicus TaxID=68203 RepID=UPI0034020EF2